MTDTKSPARAPKLADIPDAEVRPESAAKPGRFRRSASAVFATKTWGKQADILKHRASFPLLRRVISQERSRLSSLILLADLPTDVLERSKIGNLMILVVMAPAFVFALLTLTRGLAALIRFDVYFNSWLITGIPLVIFTALRFHSSFFAYRVISEELSNRTATPPADFKGKGAMPK